jgi:hypothetical protein
MTERKPFSLKQMRDCRRKTRFNREAFARVCAQTRIRSGRVDKLYVYRCPVCGFIHLTRSSLEPLGGPVTAESLGIV